MASSDEIRDQHASPGLPIPGAPAVSEVLQETAGTTDSAALADNYGSFQEEYASLIDSYSPFSAPHEHDLIQGHVVRVHSSDVIVDFGHKLEGLVPIQQVTGPDGKVMVKPGDAIDVMVDREGPQPEGYVLLSHSKAKGLRAWDTLEEAARAGTTVTGRVTERAKGGLMVDIGVLAFMPSSQVDSRPLHNLDQFIGQEIPVRIVKLNRRRGNPVVSRRMAVEAETQARKQSAFEHLTEGAIVTGTVKNLTAYGAFIDLGGVDGLLHVADMSYGRITHPNQMLQAGDEVTVKVLKIEKDKERVSLGLKQLNPDPWTDLTERLPAGSHAVGRVMSVTDYGAFVQIEPGVEGLIHISEMTWSRRMKHPNKVLKVGDQVETVVLEVKPRERRVSLGMKQLEADPWTTVAERYSVGSVVEGRVRKLTDFGLFLEIEEGIDGLVHVSDLSNKRVKHPSELVKKGQVLQAVIITIDAPNRRLSLGIKQLEPDAWETFFREHDVGDVIRGKVCRRAAFGMFVELAPGVEGLCHRSEIPAETDGGWELPIGEEFDFKVIKVSEADKRIGLSLRALAEDEERTRMENYQRRAATATISIENAMQERAPLRQEQDFK